MSGLAGSTRSFTRNGENCDYMLVLIIIENLNYPMWCVCFNVNILDSLVRIDMHTCRRYLALYAIDIIYSEKHYKLLHMRPSG